MFAPLPDKPDHPTLELEILDVWERERTFEQLREETGLEIEPGDFLGAWMDVYGDGPDAASTLNLYWEARPLTDQLRPADDIAELAWFERDELPAPEETAFTNVADVLRAWRARDSG